MEAAESGGEHHVGCGGVKHHVRGVAGAAVGQEVAQVGVEAGRGHVVVGGRHQSCRFNSNIERKL